MLPDGGDSARVSDLPVCSDQLQSFHDGSCSDDAISWILRVGFWKRQCAHADASGNREDDKPPLYLQKKVFHADQKSDLLFAEQA